MADLTGQTLGQYELGGLIGRGGMATVYRARQASMDRDVAIKIMAMELTGNPEFVARFEREARVIARLQHPHILPVIDFGRNGPYVYLVMRMVEGGVLSDRLQQTTLTLQQSNQFLGQIASALEYAHQRGVVHRDLKPNNVLLDDQDNCYLTDFGIAKMLAGTTTGANLTSTGSVMGTPSYMAPEQWRSEPVDGRTDIYALGIITYEMLMGTLPFQAETPFAMMYKHFDEQPPQPRAINPDLPEPLEQVVLRAMAKSPNDRYPSAKQLADDFSRAVTSMPPDMLQRKLPRATVEQLVAATPARQSRPTVLTEAVPLTPTPPRSTAPRQPEYTLATPTVPPAARGGGRGLLVGGALAAVALIAAVVIGVLVLGGDKKDKGKTSTPAAMFPGGDSATPTPRSIIMVVTPISSETPGTSSEPSLTPPPTATLSTELLPGLTPDTATPVSPTATPSPEPSATPIPTTVVPSATPTASFTPSNTPDLNASAEALLAVRLTQTAEGWTDTPTPDLEKTVMAAMTGTASAWTKTPTPTPTYTFTPVPTLPPPPTATRTPIPTLPPPASRTPIPTLPPAPTMTPTVMCAGALPLRMRVGSGGRTTLQPPSPTRVRQIPGLSSTVVRSIPPGQTFSVIAGPQCADGVQWWQIDVYDSSGRWNGWIGEGQSGTYWIEPFESGPVDCPGAPAPRMIPGTNGRVTLNPPTPNNIRAQPNKSASLLGEVQPGGTYEVLSGPVCDTSTHYRYWLVRTARLEGWMAEGVPGEYWMEPWP